MAVCLIFTHLSAMRVTEIAASTNLKGCPHTFGHVVYFSLQVNFWLSISVLNVDGSKVVVQAVYSKHYFCVMNLIRIVRSASIFSL